MGNPDYWDDEPRSRGSRPTTAVPATGWSRNASHLPVGVKFLLGLFTFSPWIWILISVFFLSPFEANNGIAIVLQLLVVAFWIYAALVDERWNKTERMGYVLALVFVSALAAPFYFFANVVRRSE